MYNEIGCNLHAPSLLFCDNKAVVDIIESERMTPRCRHIDIPIAFLHCHKGTTYKQQLITTDRMLADFGTKPNTPIVHKRFKYWDSGERFLPSSKHVHYKYLQLCLYEVSFCRILQLLQDDKVPLRNNNHDVTSKDGGVVVGQSGNRTDQHRSSTIDHSRESARHNMMALADHPHQKNVSKDM